jgi:predicted small lipoprotein YifL
MQLKGDNNFPNKKKVSDPDVKEQAESKDELKSLKTEEEPQSRETLIINNHS